MSAEINPQGELEVAYIFTYAGSSDLCFLVEKNQPLDDLVALFVTQKDGAPYGGYATPIEVVIAPGAPEPEYRMVRMPVGDTWNGHFSQSVALKPDLDLYFDISIVTGVNWVSQQVSCDNTPPMWIGHQTMQRHLLQ